MACDNPLHCIQNCLTMRYRQKQSSQQLLKSFFHYFRFIFMEVAVDTFCFAIWTWNCFWDLLGSFWARMSFHTRTLAYRDARGCTTCVQLMMAGGALRGRGKQICASKMSCAGRRGWRSKVGSNQGAKHGEKQLNATDIILSVHTLSYMHDHSCLYTDMYICACNNLI